MGPAPRRRQWWYRAGPIHGQDFLKVFRLYSGKLEEAFPDAGVSGYPLGIFCVEC